MVWLTMVCFKIRLWSVNSVLVSGFRSGPVVCMGGGGWGGGGWGGGGWGGGVDNIDIFVVWRC